jgi:hypothetical protein
MVKYALSKGWVAPTVPSEDMCNATTAAGGLNHPLFIALV